MEPPVAEETLRTDVILGVIFDFLTVKDLKSARSVNKKWNEIASAKVRKLTTAISLKSFEACEDYVDREERLENQDLTLKLPINVTVRSSSNAAMILLFRALWLKKSWMHRIVSVDLRYLSNTEQNGLIPCILQHLPSLRTLVIMNETLSADQEELRNEEPLPSRVTAVPPTAKIPLQSIQMDFTATWSREEKLPPPLRLEFLLFCNKLNTFTIAFEGDVREAFNDFLRSWKSIHVPTMQYETVVLDLTGFSSLEDEEDPDCEDSCVSAADVETFFKENLVEFLNISQTQTLAVYLGFHTPCNAVPFNVIRKNATLLPMIKKLTLTSEGLGTKDCERGFFIDCQGFSGLRELCLNVKFDDSGLTKKKKEIRENRSVRGYLVDVSVLKGLQKLKLFVGSCPVSAKTTLVALFHGYEPHVSLELVIYPRHDLKLSVEEFRKALTFAEDSVDTADSEDDSEHEDEI